MSVQVALAWSEETEKELLGMGFKKVEVYLKHMGGVSDEAKPLGEREFFAMRRPPYQFLVADYWGAGNE